MASTNGEASTAARELRDVLRSVKAGESNAYVGASVLESSDEVFAEIGRLTNEVIKDLSTFQNTSMDIAMGLSECFHVLSEVSAGRLDARVSDAVLQSSDELVAKFGATLNSTIEDIRRQVETIRSQQLAIAELSTPILQVWDDVLALPVIGVVDSKRTAEMMEKLLNEVVARQARFVILDITGVDVVDTRTADYFIKVIRSAELLGTKCVVTGVRPAVAQTLVELGIDLSYITTMRDLQAGLRECLRLKSLQHR